MQEGEALDRSSLQTANVPLIGGRRFWICRKQVPPEAIRATFGMLDAEFRPDTHDPIGLCVLVTGDEIDRRPEAEWPDPRMFYAGYVDRRAQVRVAYFEGAKIEPPSNRGGGSATPIPDPNLPGFRLGSLAEHDAVNEQDVLELWASEGAVPPDEARERVSQVTQVATDEAGRLVGLSTAWLRMNEQLWMDMWHYRVFVASSHRQSHLAVALTLATREHLKRRFVSGEDTRAGGVVMAIQNPVLRKLDDAIWQATDYAFIGENAGGDHLRVHYFPGATAPGLDRIGNEA